MYNIKNERIILIGGFHEVIELCELEDIKILGIIDNIKKGQYLGYEIIGTDNDAEYIYTQFKEIPIVISPDLPKKRAHLVNLYKNIGFNFTKIISSSSTVSKSANIGNGNIIQNNVNISSFVTVRNYVKINTSANIMHDSFIGSYTTVAPNAVILGRVKIGNNCYIGANSTILPNINIGDNSIIGAGSVITKNISEYKTIVGNPGREINK